MKLLQDNKALGQGRLLRRIGKADLDEIMAIERRAYPIPWSYGLFYDCVTGAYECLALERQGVILGYTVVQYVLDEAHLLNIAIDPALHRQGLGELLMDELLQRARDRHCQRVFLEVRVSNAGAQQLYLKMGFREVGQRRGYYPAVNGREDGIVMVRELAE